MRGGNELQVFKPIVGFVAVDVMNLLVASQRPTEELGYDEPVLGYVTGLVAHRGGEVVVVEDAHFDVPLLHGAAAAPLRVALTE